MLNAAANMLNISLLHTMQAADMTLKLDYGCSFLNSIRSTMQYTQRYGLEEHSLILDVDFAVSEARYKLLQQALVIYLNVEQRVHWLSKQERPISCVM